MRRKDFLPLFLVLLATLSCEGPTAGGRAGPGVAKTAEAQSGSPPLLIPTDPLSGAKVTSPGLTVGSPGIPVPTTATPTLETLIFLSQGKILFYRPVPDGKRALYIIDHTGIRMLTDGTFAIYAAVLSPDGQKIALVSDRDTPAENIYLINVDGSGLRRLTDFVGASWPAWSPDGTRIAFAARLRAPQQHADQFDIFLIDVATGALTNLTATDCCDEIGPTWSPDGQRIAFHGGWGVAVMNADGTGRRDLLPPTMAEMNFSIPFWSPDGRWIAGAFNADRYYIGAWHIYLLAPDGSSFLESKHIHIDQGYPVWSPDGEKLAFGSVGLLYVLDLASGEMTKLVRGNFPTWSPDGQEIAFEFEGFLYLLELSSGSIKGLTQGEYPQWYP